MLLKLPLLLSAAWCTYMIVTPPQPPPATEERLKPKGLEPVLSYMLILVKYLWIPLYLIEAITIVACNGGDNILSHSIRNLFVNEPGACASIRIAPMFIIYWILTIAGSSIRYSAYCYLGEMFSFELGLKKNRRLVTSGPYSIVRHPSYSGGLLAAIGIPLSILCRGSWLMECSGYAHSWLAIGGVWALAFVAFAFVLNRIGREDAMLSQGFGNEWVEWSKGVPWKLLPGVY